MPINRIHKLKDGRYSYDITDSLGEKHKLASRKNESKAEFQKRCNELDRLIESYAGAKNITLDYLFKKWSEDKWEDSIRLSKDGIDVSLSDYENTTYLYDRFTKEVFGDRSIIKISQAEIYEFLQNLRTTGYSDSLITKVKGTINRPINWGIQVLGLAIPNPAKPVVLPRRMQEQDKNKKIRVFNANEEVRFFEACKNSKWQFYFKLLILTGFRPSEALGLKWSDIDDKYITLERSITIKGLSNLKTPSSYRSFPVTDKIREVLDLQKKYYPDEEWVFAGTLKTMTLSATSSAFNRTISNTAVWKKVGRKYHGILLEEPLEHSMYDFRHTFGTRCAEAGMPVYVLAKLMGHSDSAVTQKYYISVTDKMIDDATDILNNI